MKVNKIESSIKQIDYIYHIADIHFRNLKRHEEYQTIINKFYKEIENNNLKNSIICISGDISHSKLEMSPELVHNVSKFLTECANHCPTIIISGNHDANLSNKSRMDVLTPIVNNLKHENLFYFKDSGLYDFCDNLFVVMSVFDDPDKYIKYSDLPKGILHKYKNKIVLYHGALHNAKTDVGYNVSDKRITINTFDGYDYVLAGDIHKRQVCLISNEVDNFDNYSKKEYLFKEENGIKYIIKKNPIFVYPGSLIQQNFGESLNNHGYCLWDLKNKNFKFVDIYNEYGYYTAEILDGKLLSDLKNFPKKGKLRLQISNTDTSDVKNIVVSIRNKFPDISDIIYTQLDQKSLSPAERKNLNVSENISNINVQNKILKDFLKRNYSDLNENQIDCILQINENTNKNLNIEEFNKNVFWKPIRLEFNNLFSYGEHNIIDFKKCKNIIGLFGNNASGKSSSIDSLLFSLFDKTHKCFKASQIMNMNKVTLSSLFNFEINNKSYFIKRTGIKDKRGNVKIDVEFWRDEDGERIDLTGEQRRSTNDVIRDYIGSYDDFVLTTLSVQNNISNFIEKGQSDRKDLLAKFLGIDIFDKLVTKAIEDHKEISLKLYKFNKDSFEKEMADCQIKISVKKDELNVLNQNKKLILDKISNIELEIENLKSKYIDIKYEYNLEELNSKKNKIIRKLQEYSDDFKNLNLEKSELESSIEHIKKLTNEICLSKLKKSFDEYKNIVSNISILNKQISNYKIIVKNKLNKLKHLDEHQYDPNCIYCMNNIFVKDAISTRESLESDKLTVNNLLENLKNLNLDKDKFENEYMLYEKYKNIFDELTLLNSKHELVLSKIETVKSKGLLEKSNLDEINNNIENYNKYVDTIKHNEQIKSSLDSLKIKLNFEKNNNNNLNEDSIQITSDIKMLESKINEYNKNIELSKQYEEQNNLYKYYIECVKRDGVPYDIIKNTLPILQNEINTILHQIVDFTLEFETDDKNININIVYDYGKWPLELGSGMEKFISSLAIRVGLTNISNLPRSNFLIIDEGFGVLDQEHISSIYNVFHYLKTKFEFVIVISHLDWMKDVVDSYMEIKKENNFSKIQYV